MLGIKTAPPYKTPRIAGFLPPNPTKNTGVHFLRGPLGTRRSAGWRIGLLFPRNKSGGFTIVELTVVIVVTSILLLAFLGIFTNYFVIISKNNAHMDMTVSSQNLLRSTVDTIRVGGGVRQSNSITDANAPSGGWNTSNTDFVIIIASPALDASRNYIIDSSTGSPYMNELVYYKSGSTLLQRALAHPDASGNSLKTSCPASQATPTCPEDKTLAEYVKTMVFTLYDQDNNPTTDPLLAQSVKIDLGMERTSFGSTFSLDNSIRVTLRNRF